MMKLLVFIYHFVLSSMLPVIVIALVFNGGVRVALVGTWILGWCLSYVYLDKIILFFLGAREIIDQDNQELFQQLKSETYRSFEKIPKVYLYGGNGLKGFVLSSRSEWSVVLDRSLPERMSPEQVKALVNYLVRYKKTGISWRQTKSFGLASLFVGLNFSFWSKLLMLPQDSRAFKILSFFSLAISKPYVDAVMLPGKSSLILECHESLEPLINVSRELEPGLNFNQFLFSNLGDDVSVRDLMLRRLEGFPVIERAVVKRSF